MSRADDLTNVLVPLIKASDGDIGFRSGVVSAWNPSTGESSITIAGSTITGVPFLIRAEALAIRIGDVVGILRVKSQYFVLGRISVTAGDIVVRDFDGDITVRLRRTPAGGGEIVTYHPNGVAHTVIGQLVIEETSTVVGQGFLVQQDDGTDVFGIGPLTPGGPTVMRGRDHAGNLMLSTDTGADALLDRPYLDVPMYSTSSSGSWELNSGTETAIARGRLYVTHPYLHVQVLAWCGASTTGQLRVRVGGTGGTQIGSTATVNSTSSAFFDFGGPMKLPAAQLSSPYSWAQIVITAQRTSGSNLVIAIPYGVTKRGTPT